MYALLTAHRVCMLYYRWKKAAPLVFISFVYSHFEIYSKQLTGLYVVKLLIATCQTPGERERTRERMEKKTVCGRVRMGIECGTPRDFFGQKIIFLHIIVGAMAKYATIVSSHLLSNFFPCCCYCCAHIARVLCANANEWIWICAVWKA